jgi:glycosyltransferase involved in cell wall biosynthesis
LHRFLFAPCLRLLRFESNHNRDLATLDRLFPIGPPLYLLGLPRIKASAGSGGWLQTMNMLADAAVHNGPKTPPVATWQIITCEYPSQIGGVSEYTRQLAEGLAAAGDSVEVWCPAAERRPDSNGIGVHQELGRFGIGDLLRTGRKLNTFRGPRRLLVQWVPHGFGYRSMNLPFCCWLWTRSRLRRDRVEIMFHEAYLPFRRGAWRQNIVAAVHRIMTAILLQAADEVWIAIPAWKSCLEPFTLGRKLDFQWLPVPSNVPTACDPAEVADIRTRYLCTRRFLLGHFGTHAASVTDLLQPAISSLLNERSDTSLLLIGVDSREFRDSLALCFKSLAHRIHATGPISLDDVSKHVAACDLLIQPFPDGITTRRGSAMAALAHGKPLVTTHGASTEEFWAGSGAVVLTPAGDAQALVQATLGLLADSERRNLTGQRARQLYEAEFDVARLVSRLRGEAQVHTCGQ